MKSCFRVLPIDNEVVYKYVQLYLELKRKGQLIPDADLLIAATCLVYDEILVTKDRHFERLKELGLKVELYS